MTPIVNNQLDLTSKDIEGIYGTVTLKLKNGDSYKMNGQSILKLIDGEMISIRVIGDFT